jgi:hypothetical protein
MNTRIHGLLERMASVEDELRAALHEQETRILFRVHGGRVHFRRAVRQRHKAMRRAWLEWLAAVRPRDLLTAPFVYGMVVPFMFLDLCLSAYQAVCFPLYRIAKVRRADYIVIDGQYLGYLNIIEKAHCMYCSYANGLIAYAREIAARTEQYWCPIKHARKALGTHSRYMRFLDYGDGADYPVKLEAFRAALAMEKE